MKKLLTIFTVCLLAGSVGLAGSVVSATITGRVISAEKELPIPLATIVVSGDGRAIVTDDDGFFRIDGIDGPVTVTISHVGFVTLTNYPVSTGQDNIIILERSLTILDSYVVTANRYEQEAYKVSQPITVASSEEIATKGHTIVSDVIRGFPGLDMNDAGPFRARPVIRGLFGTRVLVLVDGERLNDQRDVADFAGASMSLVDVNEIERVEVVNGPSSVLYGSDAMGGVINIITKKNEFDTGLRPIVKYAGRYSSADQQTSNRLDLGLRTDKYTVSVGAQYREANRDYAPPDNWQQEDSRYGVFRPEFYDSLNAAQGTAFTRDRLVNSRARVNNYDAKFGVKLSDQHRLDFDYGAFRANDVGYPGVPNDSTPFYFFYPNHDRDNFSLNYTGTGLTDKMAKLEGKFYYQEISKDFLTDFFGGVVIHAGPMVITPLTSLSSTEVRKFGLNFQELYQFTDQSTLTFGFDGLREEIDGGVTSVTRTESSVPFPSDVTDTSTSASVPKNAWYTLGVYSSGEIDFQPLLLTAGMRLDNFWINTEETEGYVDDADSLLPTDDETYTALNGSLGVVYPVGRGVNLVANVGSAYRVPNVVERFFYGSASGRETRPNPDIKPERSISLDFGVKAVHPQVNYSLIGFYSAYKDFTQLVHFQTDDLRRPNWRYENKEDVTIYGFESMIEGNLENGLYGNLMFTYQHGQNDTDNEPLFVSPVKTSVTVGHRHKEKHGLFGEFTIRRVEDQNRVPDITALDDIATKGFTVVDVTTGIRLFKSVRLAVSGKNLFDETYSEPFNGRNPDNPIAEAGRSFVLSINSSL